MAPADDPRLRPEKAAAGPGRALQPVFTVLPSLPRGRREPDRTGGSSIAAMRQER